VDLDYQLYQPSLTTPKAVVYTRSGGRRRLGTRVRHSRLPEQRGAARRRRPSAYATEMQLEQDVEQGSYADIITATVDF
jgi:hypothetical protein